MSPPDLVGAPTALKAFELPSDGTGLGQTPVIFAAASSEAAGWSGAALYADQDGQLVPLGGSGSRRSIIGQTASTVPPSPAIRLEPHNSILIDLISADFSLSETTPAGLANGVNRALLGDEVIQFAQAQPLGGELWRLAGLLRGRGGTEGAAQAGHPAGTDFILLDRGPILLDAARIGPSAHSLVAIGLADSGPVTAPIANTGLTLRPLAPVHPRVEHLTDGSLWLGWTRRARGSWAWRDEVEVPIVEQAESYRIGLGALTAPALVWETTQPELVINAASLAALSSLHSGASFWVRQIGSFAQSDALLLTTLS